ncbi:MAG: hypothetical protein A2170_15935 [Deltaproteobacteria bacterium RBG_13_53_10]|nr:MAG: hypothetical protein A2170_15935 [Deltaproteobacteria bacterium RBG_13_53_10]
MKPIDFRVQGFLFSGVSARIKKNGKRDFGLIFSETPARVAGLFTKNRVKAAPVLLDMERIKGGRCQAIVVNSGNANACTGHKGLSDARRVSSLIAEALGVEERLVLTASTGVIGTALPMEKMEAGVPALINSLSLDGLMQTVEAIMTTDTFPKVAVATCRIGSERVKLCGMAKGAGMIRPDLATMLSFLVTDANFKSPLLQRMLRRAAESSFNRITVDGETSTNDTVLLLANGKAHHSSSNRMDHGAEIFQDMLSEVCRDLAVGLVRDGEGATKLVEVLVKGGRSEEDANWGRILCALGHSGVGIDPGRIDVFFDQAPVVRNGTGTGLKWEEKASRVLKNKSFKITIHLHQGKSEFSLLTTDLSIDYVKINASYRS